MVRNTIYFGWLAMLCLGMSDVAVADEQAELEARILAVVKQQQALDQQYRLLVKQLEEAKTKVADARVKVEAKGTLFLIEGTGYGIRVNKGAVLVRFLCSEDKNRDLDERLKSFAGRVVVVSGFLERVEGNGIAVSLRDEKQVNLADE